MKLKEKAEEDYKKIMLCYRSNPKQMLQLPAETAGKLKIYQCLLEKAALMEQIPAISQKAMQSENFIEEVYRLREEEALDAEWQLLRWIECQMEEERQEYYYRYLHMA